MITVIGSSNTDFTIKVKCLPKVGETLSGGKFFKAFGGKGANQAAQLAKLGKPVSLIANIGEDAFGDEAIANLKNLGVDTRFVSRDNVHESGRAFIIVDKAGRNMIIVSPGSNHQFKVSHLLKAKDLIKRSKIVLLQLEIPYKVVERTIDLARPRRCEAAAGRRSNLTKRPLIILNPAPYRFKLNPGILSKIDVITPNEIEAEAISGIKLKGESSVKKAGFAILSKGMKFVVITRGKRGASVIDSEGFRTFKPAEVKAVDTTCAGDSFSAALAAGLYDGRTIDEAVQFANAVAALTVTKMCAQSSLPCLEDMKRAF